MNAMLRRRISRKIAFLVLAAFLFTTALQMHAQEHVRLTPQLGFGGKDAVLEGSVEDVAFSPNGRLVVTGDGVGMARIWDLVTGKQVRSFDAQGMIWSVAYSPNGHYVLTGSDSTVRLWEVATGRLIRTFEGHRMSVKAVAFSPDGGRVLTGSFDHSAGLWDTTSGRLILALEGHAGRINSVAFSANGKLLVTASEDKTARIWDASTGKLIRSFSGDTDEVISAALSPDGHYLLTGSKDLTTRLWNVATGEQVRIFEGYKSDVMRPTFSPDGRYILTPGDIAPMNGVETVAAWLWDVATGKRVRVFSGDAWSLGCAAFSPDGQFLVTGTFAYREKAAVLWSVATGSEIRPFAGHTDRVNSLALSKDGRLLVTAGRDGILGAWDLNTGQQNRPFKGQEYSEVHSVALSPDGRSVLAARLGHSAAELWDTTSGQLLRSFNPKVARMSSIAISPDGNSVLTLSSDGVARLWDTATGSQIRSFDKHPDRITFAAFSPDGQIVLTKKELGKEGVWIWDAITGNQISSLEPHLAVSNLVFSPDGRTVLTDKYSDKSVQLWNVANGQKISSFDAGLDPDLAQVTSLAFSPNGELAFVATSDQVGRLWDTSTAKLLRTFAGHGRTINSAVFSHDGRFIFTGSDDTTTRLWDTATGKQLATMLSFDDGGWAVTDPEGRYDASDPDNTPGLVWVTDSLRPIELKQLKKDYYTPQLLASILRGEHLRTVTGLDDIPPPPLVSIKRGPTPADRTLELSIQNAGGGVGTLTVKVNDRPVAVIKHAIAPKDSKTATLKLSLKEAPFLTGKNTISVTAFDVGDRIESYEATAEVDFPATPRGIATVPGMADTQPKAHFYAIVVGTQSFGDPKLNLSFPDADARSMATGLQLGAVKLVGVDHVHLRLLTSDATEKRDLPTKENIVAAFEDVLKKAHPEDLLVVYFSGHGIQGHDEQRSYYYLTTDASSLEIQNDPKLKYLSTVSSAELVKWLHPLTMPVKEVVILDTCAAGAASGEMAKLAATRTIPPDIRLAQEDLKDGTGSYVLMGSAADAVSYEANQYGQGLMTYALLEGMRGAAIESDMRLNVDNWMSYAIRRVPELVKSVGGQQHPEITAPKGRGFPVGMLDLADRERIPLASVKPELLRLSCHDENDLDSLGLEPLLRERLRDLSHPQARGEEAHEAQFVYLDAVVEDVVGALRPRLSYEVHGDTAVIHIRLVSGDQAGDQKLTLPVADKGALVDKIIQSIVSSATAQLGKS